MLHHYWCRFTGYTLPTESPANPVSGIQGPTWPCSHLPLWRPWELYSYTWNFLKYLKWNSFRSFSQWCEAVESLHLWILRGCGFLPCFFPRLTLTSLDLLWRLLSWPAGPDTVGLFIFSVSSENLMMVLESKVALKMRVDTPYSLGPGRQEAKDLHLRCLVSGSWGFLSMVLNAEL